ncbi:MAG: hypothetical protein A2579_10290 [Lysobacterales bacterium RIFOXYD1_FULL_69_11]|nr:MAG: hypothetical protein A2190_04080 [Xanthomonadales bacterium RIFOXYA1_FULL_69_10]OHE87391.1 MAG: hypothetical protein A2579_10290 [Xanthomonadales bacterium RIFOXYD1_FULL_69_11]
MLAAWPASSLQAQDVDHIPVQLEEIREQQARIREAIQSGDPEYRLPAHTRDRLLNRQARVLSLIEGKTTSDQLGPGPRMRVNNDLEWIFAALKQEDGDEMVCERVMLTGTRTRETICKTRAEADRIREEAIDWINRRPACGDCTGG